MQTPALWQFTVHSVPVRMSKPKTLTPPHPSPLRKLDKHSLVYSHCQVPRSTVHKTETAKNNVRPWLLQWTSRSQPGVLSRRRSPGSDTFPDLRRCKPRSLQLRSKRTTDEPGTDTRPHRKTPWLSAIKQMTMSTFGDYVRTCPRFRD